MKICLKKKIKILHNDQGGEYVGHEMKNFMEEKGITHHMSCTNTSAQNGLAERKNTHLLEITRSLLFACNAPNHYWGDAVLKAAHLINHSPSRVLKFQTPHMLLKIIISYCQILNKFASKSVWVYLLCP